LCASARGQELTQKPEVLLKPFDARAVMIYGVKLGDRAESIPGGKIVRKIDAAAAGDFEFYEMQGEYRIAVIHGKVKYLVIYNKDEMSKIGLDGRDDIEILFGVATRMEVERGASYYFYPSRHLKISGYEAAMNAIYIR
jgi:hypothetical protein